MEDSLKDNWIDKVTAVTKGLVGSIPIGGSLISEIVGTLIPNQRIDRLTKYIKVLEERITLIPRTLLNESLQKPEFIDLIEDSFFQASRAASDDRRKYIAEIVVTGIDESVIKLSESRTILRLLGEITDVEVIWLRYYGNYYAKDFRRYQNLHAETLRTVRPQSDTDEEAHMKDILQVNCRQHLERLGLLSKDNNNMDPRLLLLFASRRAEDSPHGYSITRLGLTLLKQLSLIKSVSQIRLNTLEGE